MSLLFNQVITLNISERALLNDKKIPYGILVAFDPLIAEDIRPLIGPDSAFHGKKS